MILIQTLPDSVPQPAWVQVFRDLHPAPLMWGVLVGLVAIVVKTAVKYGCRGAATGDFDPFEPAAWFGVDLVAFAALSSVAFDLPGKLAFPYQAAVAWYGGLVVLLLCCVVFYAVAAWLRRNDGHWAVLSAVTFCSVALGMLPVLGLLAAHV